jgi:hypothetical protein
VVKAIQSGDREFPDLDALYHTGMASDPLSGYNIFGLEGMASIGVFHLCDRYRIMVYACAVCALDQAPVSGVETYRQADHPGDVCESVGDDAFCAVDHMGL